MRVLPSVVLLLLSGCHFYRTANVRVLDMESREPIAGATVRTSYMLFLDLFPPKTAAVVTDETGLAKIRIARGWDGRLRVDPEAPGYVGGYVTTNGSIIAPGHPLVIMPRRSSRDPWPKRVFIEMWKAPMARFEVILPNGFRGRFPWTPDITRVIDLSPGQRVVILELSPDGMLRVPLTRPILIGFSPNAWTFRYADGTTIPSALPSCVGLRQEVRDDVVAVHEARGGAPNVERGLFVGTKAEAVAAAR